MRTKFALLAIIAVLAVVIGTVHAQQGRPRAGTGQPCGLGVGLGPAAVNELNLTSEQVNRLQRIQNQFVSATEPARSELQTRLQELAQLWTADNPNEAAIRNKIAQIDALRARIRNAMVDRTLAAMRVLTPDQRAKMRNFVGTCPGFEIGACAALGLGCDMPGAGCYIGGPGCGKGYMGGRNK